MKIWNQNIPKEGSLAAWHQGASALIRCGSLVIWFWRREECHEYDTGLRYDYLWAYVWYVGTTITILTSHPNLQWFHTLRLKIEIWHVLRARLYLVRLGPWVGFGCLQDLQSERRRECRTQEVSPTTWLIWLNWLIHHAIILDRHWNSP